MVHHGKHAEIRAPASEPYGESPPPFDSVRRANLMTVDAPFGSSSHASAEEPAIVVDGSSGHGEFAGMLLGSVNEFLATHASCPVAIIRDHGDAHQTSH